MLEIRMLGQFDVRWESTPIDIPSRPAQSLLAYLALHPNTAHRREKLAGLFWPDAREENARSYLRKALWQVRKSLPGELASAAQFIHADDISIDFEVNAETWSDVDILDRELEDDATIEEMIAAVSLYSGELLPGFYEEWVTLERERLQAIFERKIKLLLDKLVQGGHWAETLEWAERWIALGGVPEPAYRALMIAHASQGDMSKVVTVYERCVRDLRDNLDVEPSEQTATLYEELLTGEYAFYRQEYTQHLPKSTSPRRATNIGMKVSKMRQENIPIPITSFIGREKEIAELKHLISDVRLVTLTGAGGSGKTRLAIEVSRELVDEFKDGVWWIDLSSLTDPALVPQSLAKTLGVREIQNETMEETLANTLRDSELLLVLDNCEHLVEICAGLADRLLHECADLKIMSTSREVLGVPGEWIFQVPTLSLPDSQREATIQILAYEAIRLFVERSKAVNSEFSLSDQNAAAVAQICRSLDGIPLAIELAAARIKMLSAEQIAFRLSDRFRLLVGGSRTTLPHHQTLRMAIDWSYDLLPVLERRLLRRLSVFSAGWSLEAAEEVCIGDGINTEDVLELLSQLVNKSLVIALWVPESRVRYRMLETVREYSEEKLAEGGEEIAIRSKHLEYYVRLVEKAEPKLFTVEQAVWLDLLETEIDNLRAAIEWGLTREPAIESLRLIGALWRYVVTRSHDFREWQERSLRVLSSPNTQVRTRERARALNSAVILQWIHRNPAEAKPLLEEALEIGRELSSKSILAWSLHFLGQLADFEGQYELSRAYFEDGAAIGRELGPAYIHILGWSLAFQGDFALNQGDPESAKKMYELGAAQLKEQGDKSVQAYPIRRLSYLAINNKDYEKASALLKESLSLNQEILDKRGISACLAGFAALSAGRGHFIRAARLLGAVEATLKALNTNLLPTDHLEYIKHITLVRSEMDETAFAVATAEGRVMTLDQAVTYALAEEEQE